MQGVQPCRVCERDTMAEPSTDPQDWVEGQSQSLSGRRSQPCQDALNVQLEKSLEARPLHVQKQDLNTTPHQRDEGNVPGIRGPVDFPRCRKEPHITAGCAASSVVMFSVSGANRTLLPSLFRRHSSAVESATWARR